MTGPEVLDGIDWPSRQARAAIPYEVIDGLPVNPARPDLPEGRGDLWVWGEQQAADALVMAWVDGVRHVLLVLRGDGHGWAIPGGMLDPGETPEAAARRELLEETALDLSGHPCQVDEPQYMDDPRAGQAAWVVSSLAVFDLGVVEELPVVTAGDDAAAVAWVPADTFEQLVGKLADVGGVVFPAHVATLRYLLG
ncbi:NUDIX domain-containing protein [Herbidospora daliensis]|uniref:NUDIX domain-containing protein n=1 Tax=Herbidospora daliensis TaxID=295585 RepID=UPI000781216A|nr:NUDIX domain-containing protein [Herbidospora daliensis]